MDDDSKKKPDEIARKERADRLRRRIREVERGGRPSAPPTSPREFVDDQTKAPPKKRPEGGA